MHAWQAPQLPRLPGRGQPLRIHDTATNELATVANAQTVKLYVCGITPYDATHIGHAATYIAFDTLQRVLIDGGTELDFCENVTDVDDPLLERAAKTQEPWQELADRETALFRDDMQALRLLPPRSFVGAVEAIPEIVEVIGRLREAGAAYDVNGDIYFSVAANPRFGSVGHLTSSEMLRLSGERGGDPDRPGKKDPLDSLLWRAQRPGEPAWDSPFGPGRPGWHVECAAIALDRLGETIDIQGGGRDLIFPHHEHSAACAELATGHAPFAAAYVHAGMVALDGEKMSKSRGNLVFVSTLLRDGVEPAAIRLAILDHHYREDWEWTAADLNTANQRLARWRAAVAGETSRPAEPLLHDVRRNLSNDLATPQALAAIDKWATDPPADIDPAAPQLATELLDALLGIQL